MIANKDDLGVARLGLVDEPGELAAPDRARLVDDEHVAAAECAAVVLPTVFIRRQRAALDTGRFLQALGRLARQARTVNRVALCLPCPARRRELRALARAGITDNRRDLLRPGDMLDRPALLVGKTR